jgi:hypothetical protein
VKNDRFDALTALLEAVRIERVRHGHIFVTEADRPELRRALEARFLKELAERFPKVVKRAAEFDWLPFSDPQLREASRCYLYGFFRGALLLAAAALEGRLKAVAGVERFETYEVLVDLVFGQAGVWGKDAARAAALKDLFRRRNTVAHRGVEPQVTDAARALDLVRGTLEVLSEQLDGPPLNDHS